MLGDAAYDEAWVLVVDGPASIADMAGEDIARGYTKLDFSAALVAEVHVCMRIRVSPVLVDAEASLDQPSRRRAEPPEASPFPLLQSSIYRQGPPRIS
jgi:hypothetical protein